MKIDSKSQYVDYISIVADAVPNLDLRTNKIMRETSTVARRFW